MGDLRIRLIERLCRFPEEHLAQVDELLVRLEKQSVATAPATQLGPDLKASTAGQLDWPHAPVHRLSEHGTFIVTASTLRKEHFFRGAEKLTMLQETLLRLAKPMGVVLEAWAVFSNHYHFVAHTTGDRNQLADFLARLHYDTAEAVNRWNGCPGREVWFNYWDTQLTFESSYFSRLNYVH